MKRQNGPKYRPKSAWEVSLAYFRGGGGTYFRRWRRKRMWFSSWLCRPLSGMFRLGGSVLRFRFNSKFQWPRRTVSSLVGCRVRWHFALWCLWGTPEENKIPFLFSLLFGSCFIDGPLLQWNSVKILSLLTFIQGSICWKYPPPPPHLN